MDPCNYEIRTNKTDNACNTVQAVGVNKTEKKTIKVEAYIIPMVWYLERSAIFARLRTITSWSQDMFIHKGCSKNYSQGGHFFFPDPSTPRTHMESEPPRPPGHVSALINLPHYGSNTPWPPGQVTSPPPPLGHIVNKTPSTHRTKVFAPPPPPEDNFWNSPKPSQLPG